MTDEEDDGLSDWNGCAVVALAVGLAVAGILADSLILPLFAVPVAATGSVVGLFARGSRAGRIATAGGLAAVFLSLGAALFVYGRAMAGMGLAR